MIPEPISRKRKRKFLCLLLSTGGFVSILIGSCAIVSSFLYLAYTSHWAWTGFNAAIGPNVLQYQPTKTLWDWLQLLIVPAVLALAAIAFNLVTMLNERRFAAQKDRTEHEITLDNQRETLLQEYLDRMSDLLLSHHLRNTEANVEARDIARARTLTVLSRLDGARKGSLLRFLYESCLIGREDKPAIIDLREADLTKADLSRAKLYGVNLAGANLSNATLRFTNLSKAKMDEANLNEANLTGANLIEASLKKTQLGRAKLNMARCIRANFNGADLKQSDLSFANFSWADLTEANLKGVDTEGADFDHATYTDAQQEQIMQYK